MLLVIVECMTIKQLTILCGHGSLASPFDIMLKFQSIALVSREEKQAQTSAFCVCNADTTTARVEVNSDKHVVVFSIDPYRRIVACSLAVDFRKAFDCA